MVRLSLASGLAASVILLPVAILRAPTGSNVSRLRIFFIGTTLGLVPFPLLTLVPGAMGIDEPVPPHWSVLPVALIPLSFAYAILQQQLWGIRRLVHRGLVYGLLSIALLLVVFLGVTLAERVFPGVGAAGTSELWLLAAVMAFRGRRLLPAPSIGPMGGRPADLR